MLELRKRADKSGDPLEVDEDGNAVRWPLAGVELVGKAPAEHGFSDELVGRALAEGWAEFVEPSVHVTEGYGRNPVVTGKFLVLKLDGGDVTYEVEEAPGRYGDRVTHEYRCKLVKKGAKG